MFRSKKTDRPALEEALSDEWAMDLGVAEVPLGPQSLVYFGLAALLIGLVVIFRIFDLGASHSFYRARAEANLSEVQRIPAPRGLIVDYRGEVLAENRPVFLALLDVKGFFVKKDLQKKTLEVVAETLGMTEEEVWNLIRASSDQDFSGTIILNSDLDQSQLIKLESLNLPTITVSRGFSRYYPQGPVFSSLVGYTGVVSEEDLRQYPELGSRDFVGKTGLEAFYEEKLRGKRGMVVKLRDAQGNVLEGKEEKEPEIGQTLRLSIDAKLESYFYKRLEKGLLDLGRSVAVGLAIDPRDGRILALVNLPGFDNNLFNTPGKAKEIKALFDSPHQPLFNRAVGGVYAPGSTIKPLHAVAALEEKVISPQREIFSPGYLDVPNPYKPDEPTRFLDWRHQGNVNIASAIAQSSNVYFYIVGGGAAGTGIKGLGISSLNEWWRKFGLGSLSGVDLFGEAKGSLPDIASKEKRTNKPWLLGDTYNVSIGQGDLLVTPLQLIGYISAIANGGKIYRPFLALDFNQPTVIRDLSNLSFSIKEVQKGMEKAVTSPLGTAYSLHNLPFPVAAKTGSAQIKNKQQENAFFVGYAPAQNPEIAILVLVENSREGSLNALPIAKDVLDWYYLNRMSGNHQKSEFSPSDS